MNNAPSRTCRKVKSKVVIPPKDESVHMDEDLTHTVQFQEEGDTVQMEINDGGDATIEFSSENDQSEQSESDSENDNDSTESGEVSDQDQSEQTDDIQESSQDSLAVEAPKQKRKKKNRQSLEDRLDTMSSALLLMTEILKQNGLVHVPGDNVDLPKKKANDMPDKDRSGKNSNSEDSLSETTIYRDALDKLEVGEVPVDPEIIFKVNQASIDPDKVIDKNKRESSSSEDKIDTSDELMDIDIVM